MKKYLFCLILFLQFSTYLDGKEGTLILLYGTQCSGKSTLAEALKVNLKGNYIIEKKTDLSERFKREIIFRETGVMLTSREEVLQATRSLPPHVVEEVSSTAKRALQIKLEEINQKILRGENIILDVCLSQVDMIDRIEGRKIKVLVYAPLSVLLERDKQRVRMFDQSKLFQQRRRSSTLSLFSTLYRPTASSPVNYLDILTRREAEAFIDVEEIIYARFEDHSIFFIEQFMLDTHSSVLIVPAVAPDIFINTSTETTVESVKRIQDFLGG